jgi:hypothetical protein
MSNTEVPDEVKIKSTEELIRNIYEVVLNNVFYTYEELMDKNGGVREFTVFNSNDQQIDNQEEITLVQRAVDAYLRNLFAKVETKIKDKTVDWSKESYSENTHGYGSLY